MVGRAGRPRYDTVGKAVIMTNEDHERYYSNLVSNKKPVESMLASCLGEYLNSEVAIGTLRSHEDVQAWMRTTFLYIRLLENPSGESL
jgi:replicative superfamily II helicase